MVGFFFFAFNFACLVVKSPITKVVWSAVTGRPYTTQAVVEEFSKTKVYAYLKFRTQQAAHGAFEAAQFDPKNPHHYQPSNNHSYNPFSVKLKAFKAAFSAARDAIIDSQAGKAYQPPVQPHQMRPSRPIKPITRSDHLLENSTIPKSNI